MKQAAYQTTKRKVNGIIFICEKEDKSKVKVRDNNLNHMVTP